jgi:hypothetical protein
MQGPAMFGSCGPGIFPLPAGIEKRNLEQALNRLKEVPNLERNEMTNPASQIQIKSKSAPFS